MSHDDELRSRIGRLADTHDVAPLTADEVIARRSRGVLRQRLLAVAAAVLLVAGVAGVVVLLTGDDPDVDVADGASDDGDGITVEGSDDRSGDDPVTADPPPGSNDEATTTSTTMAFPDAGDAIDLAGGGGPDWIVPWGDGFLAIGQVFEPSDIGIEDLVPDIRDRFPDEIIAAVESAGAVTLQEMIDAVTEAGLLDQATEIFTADPELVEAFDEVQRGGTWRFAAQVSDDGETWTELPDFSLPSGQEWAQQVASDGTTLVVVEQRWDESGLSSAQVATTSDLTEWTVTDIPMPADATPDFVQSDIWVNDLALGDDEWYLTLTRNTWIDPWSMVPGDVLTELDELGVGYGFDASEDGLQVLIFENREIVFDAAADDPIEVATTTVPVTTIPPPDPQSGVDVEPPPPAVDLAPPEEFEPFEPEVHSVIPWSELPLTYEEYLEFQVGGTASIAFVGGFDGTLAQATTPAGFDECCTVIGTDAGFVAQGWRDGPPMLAHSDDGQSWIDIPLPDGIDWVNAIAPVQDGVVLVDQDGGVWRGDADGAGWQSVTIPGLPANAWLWFQDTGGRGIATAIDIGTFGDVDGATTDDAPDAAAPEPLVDEGPGGQYTPDFWLVATVDGITWHVEDLPEPVNDGYGGQAAVNGTVAVLRTWSGDWRAFAIG